MEFMQTRHGKIHTKPILARHGKIYTKPIKHKPLVVMNSMPATHGNQAMLWIVTVDSIYRVRGVFSLNIAQTWVSHGGLRGVPSYLPKLSAL